MVGATMVGTDGKVCILAIPEALETHFWCCWEKNIKEIE